MKRADIFGFVAAVVALAAAHVGGQTSSGNDTETTLARLQMTYENELGKLDADKTQQAVALQGQYLKSLETLQGRLQKSGKLDPILAIRTERERFEKERTLDQGSLSESMELQRVQNAYLTALRELDVSQSRRILDLAGKYDRSLNSLQERVTREGKLDTAVLIKERREELTRRPEVSAARFATAEAEAEAGQTAPAVPPPATPGTAETAADGFVGDPKPYIRNRFKKFCDALAKDDMDKARSYIDPRFVDRKGRDVVNGLLALLVGPYVKLARIVHGQLDPGTVEVDADGMTAWHRPRVWVESRWKETRPTYRVQRDGDWYFDMEKRPGPPMRREGERKDGERKGGPFGRPGRGVKGDGIPPRRSFRGDG